MRTHISHSVGFHSTTAYHPISNMLRPRWHKPDVEVEAETERARCILVFHAKPQPRVDPVCTIVGAEALLFARLLRSWHQERGITSSLSDITSCPSYLQIIGMGEKAVPLILRQLKREGDDPDHWFAALEAVARHDPVPRADYGDTVKMAEAWFRWADANDAW